ncbi:MAG: hypothetical protein KAF40_03990 [Flavihumibacter sp.]|nr:hypothetical protein [Flavihumibacter sp.]
MVKQYPHSVFVTIPATAQQNSDGNWVHVSGSGLDFESPCRLEPRLGSNNAYIVGADGVKVEINAVVYLPKSCPTIPVGALMRISDGISNLITTNVKQFSKGQLNARAWL